MRDQARKRKGSHRPGAHRAVRVCFSCRCFIVGKSRKPKHGR